MTLQKLFVPPFKRCIFLSLKFWIFLHQFSDCLVRLLQRIRIRIDISQRKVQHAALTHTEQIARTTQLHIPIRNLESIVRFTQDIETLADLAGRTLAVQATTKPEELFLHPEESGVPELRALISLQNRELIYPFLSKGYADAVAAHETSILQYMADYGVNYRILDEPLLTAGLGAAFAKNDTRGLEQELDRVLAEMRGDGTAAEIIGAYLPDAERYLEVDADAD